MADAIDRVQRSAEKGFNALLDLFGTEVLLTSSGNTQTISCLVEKPLQVVDSDATAVNKLDATFQFLKSSFTLDGLDKITWESKDWFVSNESSLNKDDDLGIYSCIATLTW